jgi:hypothetical protein
MPEQKKKQYNKKNYVTLFGFNPKCDILAILIENNKMFLVKVSVYPRKLLFMKPRRNLPRIS